ncbi:MAG: alpha/beta fold hydrolase [Gammaproteobacteria bacterium]|nr:alpha/beta fold hydrolase [Gammaproteobacteria bacterium]
MTSIWNHLQGLEFKQSYYNAGGVMTRAIEAGEGPVLILLHGTGGHAEAYLKNIEAHAKHFHVYAIDMVGHGYSDAPDISYDMQCYVDFMRDFLDAIGADKAHISGESLGATVASWFALAYPDRVNKIVMNTGMMLPPDEKGSAELQELLDRSRKASGTPNREMIRQRISWLMHDDKDVTDEIVEVRYQIYQQPGRADVIRTIAEQSIGALLDPVEQDKWYNPELLKKLSCPTLVLWTRFNPGQLVHLAEEGAALIPDSDLVILENSAHWPQWEEMEEFNKAHIDYLLK